MLRLFFALQPAPEKRRALAQLVTPLAVHLHAQPVPAENLHATLCFIGAVPQEHVEALVAAAAAIRGARSTLRFDAIDFWRKPRILCATAPEEPANPANALARAIADGVRNAGFKPDLKPFRPHVTLVRKVSPKSAATLTWPQEISPGLVVRCEKFVLMESRRGERGSIYSVLKSWPLYADGGS